MEQEHTEKEIQVVAFVLNNEEFACDINNVREVSEDGQGNPASAIP